MNTLEELKDLITNKGYGEKLITFDKLYLCDIGDPSLYLRGVGVVNGKLVLYAFAEYGGDIAGVYLGSHAKVFSWTKGIPLTDDTIVNICDRITKEEIGVDFDFNTMKGIGCNYVNGRFLEGMLTNENKEELDSYLDGNRAEFCIDGLS